MRTARLAQQVPAHKIQAVKEATDLAALVSDYLPLKKSGPQWLVSCPWHDDKEPSCRVYADHLHCFSCSASGDVFTFLQRLDGVSFNEALKRLAERAGISLDAQPVSRLNVRYARAEAEIAQWWWKRRRDAVMTMGCAELADEEPDQDFLSAAYRVRQWADGLMKGMDRWPRMTMDDLFLQPGYQVFRDAVTTEERAEHKEDREYEAAWSEAWISLATLPVVAHSER